VSTSGVVLTEFISLDGVLCGESLAACEVAFADLTSTAEPLCRELLSASTRVAFTEFTSLAAPSPNACRIVFAGLLALARVLSGESLSTCGLMFAELKSFAGTASEDFLTVCWDVLGELTSR